MATVGQLTADKKALDPRTIVENEEAIDNITQAYVGLIIYNKENGKLYKVTEINSLSGKVVNSIVLPPSSIGAQPEINNNNKLSADNIVDGTTNKVVTQTDKTNWNGKQDALTPEQLSNITKGGTALQPSSTSGLLKNDGTIDTETQSKAANAIQMPASASANKVLGYENGNVAWVDKPSNGKSAYEIWYEENEYDDPTIYNEDYFLASLKAQFGNFIPADYGTNGVPASGGSDITPSADTVDYIYLVDNDANTPTAKTMWITVVNDSNPNNITYSWTSIGDVQVNLTFATEQPVANVHIKDENGDDVSGSAGVLSSSAGASMAKRINDIENHFGITKTWEEVDVGDVIAYNIMFDTSLGYIRWNANQHEHHYMVPVTAGDTVKVTAQDEGETSPNGTAYNSSEIAFFTTNETPVSSGQVVNLCPAPNNEIIDIPLGTSKDIVIPSGCAFLYIRGNNTDSTQTNSWRKPKSVKILTAINTIPERIDELQEDVDNAAQLIEANKTRIENIESSFEGSSNWEEINLGEEYSYNAISNQSEITWNANQSEKHYMVPVEIGQKIKITAQDENTPTDTGTTYDGCEIMFFKELEEPSASQIITKLCEHPNDGIVNVPLGNELEIEVPADCTYLYIRGNNRGSRYSYSWRKPKSVTVFKPIIKQILDKISDQTHSDTSIFGLHPDKEVLPKFMQMREYGRGTGNGGCFIFAHTSDNHGVGATAWNRFINFVNYWKGKGYIDEAIDTGDAVYDAYGDSLAWRNGAENVLFTIGNHETYSASGSSSNVWHNHVGVDAYNAYIGPNVSNWNVKQPTNAATEGKCYYHKDYHRTLGSTQTLRAVFCDVMGWDADEATWLSNILSEAQSNGYSVVIFCHMPPSVWKPIDCRYSSYLGNSCNTPGWTNKSFDNNGNIINVTAGKSNFNEDLILMAKVVHDFQVSGGDFVGYVCGHYHFDSVGRIYGKQTIGGSLIDFDDESYPQLIYMVGCGKMDRQNDYLRADDTLMADNFQVIGINTVTKKVKLMKIGCNIDVNMRSKDTISVSYAHDAFDSSKYYIPNDVVVKDGVLYKYVTHHIGDKIWSRDEVVEFDRVID